MSTPPPDFDAPAPLNSPSSVHYGDMYAGYPSELHGKAGAADLPKSPGKTSTG